MADDIELGDKVRCMNSGFVGVAISKTEFINGCVQYEVMPKVDKDNKLPDGLNIDSQSLELVSKKKKKIIKKETGGRMKRINYYKKNG